MVIESMEFKLFHNVASEREYRPTVFTPPRDDFAMLGAPRKFDDLPESGVAGDDAHPTRQALCVVMRVVCCFMVTLLGIASFYVFETWLVKEPTMLHCEVQKLQHGYILPGQVGDKAMIRCDEDYMIGAPVNFRCYMIAEHCVIAKKATVMVEEVKKCWRKYAFVPDRIGKKGLMNESSMQELHEQMAKLYESTAKSVPNACLKSPLAKSTRLYKEDHRLAMDFLGGQSAKAVAIALIALMALVVAAIIIMVSFAPSNVYNQFMPIGTCPPSAVDDLADIDEVNGILS